MKISCLQIVIDKFGEQKISQFSYLDMPKLYQGILILHYLQNCDIDKYQNNLKYIKKLTRGIAKEFPQVENFKETYPYLFTDCGYKINKMIEDGIVECVDFFTDNIQDVCEFKGEVYIIDFQNMTFTTRCSGFKKTYSLSSSHLPSIETYIEDLHWIF